jgi:hypothetical protein
MMNLNPKIAAIIYVPLALLYGAVTWYAQEHQQLQYIDDATVESIEAYTARNDLHMQSQMYQVRLEGIAHPVAFSQDRWDTTLEPGDSIDLVVKELFPTNALYGLAVMKQD